MGRAACLPRTKLSDARSGNDRRRVWGRGRAVSWRSRFRCGSLRHSSTVAGDGRVGRSRRLIQVERAQQHCSQRLIGSGRRRHGRSREADEIKQKLGMQIVAVARLLHDRIDDARRGVDDSFRGATHRFFAGNRRQVSEVDGFAFLFAKAQGRPAVTAAAEEGAPGASAEGMVEAFVPARSMAGASLAAPLGRPTR